MASGMQCGATGVTASIGSATTALSPNTRVKAAAGALATVSDVLQFPSGIGNWLVPATRCTIGGLPAITSASQGLATNLASPTPTPAGPLSMTAADLRAEGT